MKKCFFLLSCSILFYLVLSCSAFLLCRFVCFSFLLYNPRPLVHEQTCLLLLWRGGNRVHRKPHVISLFWFAPGTLVPGGKVWTDCLTQKSEKSSGETVWRESLNALSNAKVWKNIWRGSLAGKSESIVYSWASVCQPQTKWRSDIVAIAPLAWYK